MENYQEIEKELEMYKQEYAKLESWCMELQKGKEFLEEENRKMKSWCGELEQDKRNVQEQLDKQNEKNEELEMQLAASENERSKIQYKLNRILEDAKAKKVIESRKLLEF